MGTERPQPRTAAQSAAQRRREHGEHGEDANDHREHGGILLGAMGDAFRMLGELLHLGPAVTRW